jgi:hypothetical protein
MLRIIRLITGEEFIGEITKEDKTAVKVKNPVRINVVPSRGDPTMPSVGLSPWAAFSDDKEFVINKGAVVCIMTPVVEFENQYKAMFGGLVKAQSKIILPEM